MELDSITRVQVVHILHMEQLDSMDTATKLVEGADKQHLALARHT